MDYQFILGIIVCIVGGGLVGWNLKGGLTNGVFGMLGLAMAQLGIVILMLN